MICCKTTFYCYYNSTYLPIPIQNKKQTFHYTRSITPKRVTSLRYLSPRHRATANTATCVDVEAVANRFVTLCKIWPVRDYELQTSRTRGTRVNSSAIETMHKVDETKVTKTYNRLQWRYRDVRYPRNSWLDKLVLHGWCDLFQLFLHSRWLVEFQNTSLIRTG